MVMPSAADKPPPEPNNVSSPSEGPENPVDSFLSLIQEFCAGGDFSRLKAMCQENKELNAKINQLESAYDQNIQALTSQNLLANFFDLALKHMEVFLRGDLDDACLADSATWIELRMRVSSQQRIPLPASNSPGAKRMRIVAGLVIFGEALADYIFRPTHTAQDSELDDVLGRLGTQNYLQEMYVRAALLRVLPDRQRKNQEAAVKSVVTHVSDVLGVLMPSSRRGEFESRLKLVSDEICHGWSQVQQLEERVRPSFSFDFAEEWQPLPSSGPQTSTKPNPSPSTQSTTQQQKNGRQTQQQPKPRPEVLTKEEFKEVAWPAFLATNPEQAQDGDGANSSSWVSIHRGYVLTKAQAKGAEQERTAEEEASRRVRKTIRQNDGNDPRQTQRKRRDSGIGGFFHS
ncbi:hypothetical protein BGZ61DRAFT_485146 [Ilyonectria robusta]|uniref:uncharacterized protein n=1 Tax=Ilyonectria robusta TaxID=1079257 RepID=UPI001E8D36A6|nr:uncharacterized protein BGZ61DRAFT_485146 [Ilyonectria robusta]KAH8662659.1 hypothetical protein BGZ61DRAFT_485146 [Ilyonectria robusta]